MQALSVGANRDIAVEWCRCYLTVPKTRLAVTPGSGRIAVTRRIGRFVPTQLTGHAGQGAVG